MPEVPAYSYTVFPSTVGRETSKYKKYWKRRMFGFCIYEMALKLEYTSSNSLVPGPTISTQSSPPPLKWVVLMQHQHIWSNIGNAPWCACFLNHPAQKAVLHPACLTYLCDIMGSHSLVSDFDTEIWRTRMLLTWQPCIPERETPS